MVKKPLISVIIIDYKQDNPYLTECLEAIRKQTYRNFEIILVTDYPVTLPAQLSCHSDRSGGIFPSPSLTKKSFGHYVGPAQKRDWGAKKARGEILAFIDDDAYPAQDWLMNIVRNFSDLSIACVGGPGVTPPMVSWREEASGWMSASPLGAGVNTYRFYPSSRKFVDDYPSMNLAVRRSDFLAVGGYDSHFWPGEDTKLCLDIVTKLKKKIIYDPKVLVYHHRRLLWKPHLRQNGSFGVHRGFFARILPRTSFRPIYLGPSFMVLGLVYLLLSSITVIAPVRLWWKEYSDVAIYPNDFLTPIFNWLYVIGCLLFALYLLSLAANSVWVYQKSKSIFQGILSFFVVFITHLWYGLRFLQGFLLTKKLSR